MKPTRVPLILSNILAVLLSVIQANAADSTVGAQFRDFSGGLNDAASGINLQPKDSQDLLNVVIDDPIGSIKPRKGFARCGSMPSGSTATELFTYSKADGTSFIIAADNQNIYKTRDCVTWTRILDSQNSSFKPEFAIVRDKLWIVNGSTHAYTYDGATTTILDGRTNTPNPAPMRGRYIEFWKERVWIARSGTDPSALAFSAVTDSAGNDLDPSTGTTAWPATNVIYIDREAGSPIYGIKSYRDNLYVFKDNGIWRIDFNSDFDLAVRKTQSAVGSRFGSSIVELDNFLYFVGPDGIYAFNGDDSQRISDKISNKFSEINQPTSNSLYRIWDSASDFAAGTLTNTSTETSVGYVVPQLIKFDDFGDGDFTASPVWSIDAGTGSWSVSGNELVYANTATGGISSTGSATNYSSGGMWSWRAKLGRNTNDYVRFHFMSNAGRTIDNSCGYTLMVCVNVSGLCVGGGGYPNGVSLTRQGSGSTVILGSYEETPDTEFHLYRIVKNGVNFTVYKDNAEIITAADDACSTSYAAGIEASGGGTSPSHKFDDIRIGVSSYSTITSDIYNAVTVSSWSTFDADYEANGGSFVFDIRYGISESDVNATTWTTIVPGAIIPAFPYQTYTQWRASISASTMAYVLPGLDAVSVNWNLGGTQSQTIHGGRYKNRYWVSASTGSSTTNNLVLVNSKYDKSAWVPYDLRVGPFLNFNDNFYAAASTHSAINRLDYTTNDAGVAIPWYWTSRDEVWGQPYNRKRLFEISSDFTKASGASSVNIGYSTDQGSSFTNSSVNMAGSGRGTDRRFVSGFGYDFRLRVGSTSLDVAPTILGLTGWANIQPGRQ